MHVLRFLDGYAWWLQLGVFDVTVGQNSKHDAGWLEDIWNWLKYRGDAFYVHDNVFRQLGEEG
jgi:hypothetical protein